MKRSEQIRHLAKQHLLNSILSAALSVAAGTWASTAFLSDGGQVGTWTVVAAVVALALALLLLMVAVTQAMESLYLTGKARREERCEYERSIRRNHIFQ